MHFFVGNFNFILLLMYQQLHCIGFLGLCWIVITGYFMSGWIVNNIYYPTGYKIMKSFFCSAFCIIVVDIYTIYVNKNCTENRAKKLFHFFGHFFLVIGFFLIVHQINKNILPELNLATAAAVADPHKIRRPTNAGLLY